MKNFLLRYQEVIDIIKSSVHPIVLCIVLYYTIVTLTLWPVVVWGCFEIILLFGIGIIVIKDVISDKIAHRNIEYHPLESTSKNDVPKEEVVDWSYFDMSNYPKVNYRKVFWVDKGRVGAVPSYNKYIARGYPWGDISVFVWIVLSLCTTYEYMQKEEFVVGRFWLATAGLLVMFLLYVPKEGRRLYVEQCKVSYKCDYLKEQKEQNKAIEMKEKAIALEEVYNGKKQADVSVEIKDDIMRQMKEQDIQLDQTCVWYMNRLVHQKDIILLKEDNGQSLCVKKTMEARDLGLPDNYYVVAVQDTTYLCGCRWESALYRFSKGLGITRTIYFSLLEYIIEE